jgi:hypothetical protein
MVVAIALGNPVDGVLLERVGLRRAQRLGWRRVSGDRSPTLRELRDGLRGYLVVRICLDEPVGRRRRQVAVFGRPLPQRLPMASAPGWNRGR